MENKAKISIQDLNLYYGDFHALKGINMELPEKEISAFIGPSGCGKSTLLKSINRMNDLVEGCIPIVKVVSLSLVVTVTSLVADENPYWLISSVSSMTSLALMVVR